MARRAELIFKGLNRVLVTGPHRAGTTLTTEIVADELGLPAVRESELAHPRFPGDDEPKLSMEDVLKLERGVLQGATTFKWLPTIGQHFDAVVIVKRNIADIQKSQKRYRGRYLDDPLEKYHRLQHMPLPLKIWVSYEELLSKHERFCTDRSGWAPRQTTPC